MENAIVIEGLKKQYGELEAVKGIDLTVRKGEMFGLVGPDGAGKTSTLRMLCGLTKPADGAASVLGLDVQKDKNKLKNRTGYLSQKFSLYGDLSVDENIEFFADIHGVKNYQERRNELLEFTRMTPFRKRQAERLSGGMKQKLALACSLIHRPDVLFLDEPTIGVDPVSRRDFWKILSELLREGMTILLTTPYLDEAERCERVALMNQGRIISMDTPDGIKNAIKREVIEFICSPIREAYKYLRDEGGYDVQLFGDRLDVVVENAEEALPRLKEQLESNGIEITGHRFLHPSLENVFIYLVQNEYA